MELLDFFTWALFILFLWIAGSVRIQKVLERPPSFGGNVSSPQHIKTFAVIFSTVLWFAHSAIPWFNGDVEKAMLELLAGLTWVPKIQQN
jgi:hypothetical protein